MATHSNVLAWRIPGTGEPGGLPSMGLHRIGHDWSDLAAALYPMLISFCFFFNIFFPYILRIEFEVSGLIQFFFLITKIIRFLDF